MATDERRTMLTAEGDLLELEPPRRAVVDGLESRDRARLKEQVEEYLTGGYAAEDSELIGAQASPEIAD